MSSNYHELYTIGRERPMTLHSIVGGGLAFAIMIFAVMLVGMMSVVAFASVSAMLTAWVHPGVDAWREIMTPWLWISGVGHVIYWWAYWVGILE